ncbi:MAG TPA: DUF4097 family beta strand repeat-containing protein [Candidatus Nitrosotenuis sp.]|nr:DUF4097 family beta strand repeat-containing protein [Candidatus Nitrosotenuis sp.]
MKSFRLAGIFLLTLSTLLAAGCIQVPGPRGKFDRTFTVSGPVRIELANGSGRVHISSGPAGQVRVQGEFEVRQWIWDPDNLRAEDFEKDPPIEQRDDILRIGFGERWRRNVRVEYTITAPVESSLRVQTGSGDVNVSGVRGPVRLNTGSGDVSAQDIREEVVAGTGSGRIVLRNLGGPVRADTGSGDIVVESANDEVRANTGSGQITVTRPRGRVVAGTGSGDVRVSDSVADLRVRTSSGEIVVDGNPQGRFLWDLDASSGNIRLDLADSAGFRLFARTSSGRIETDLPLTIEEQQRRSLRARAGSGEGRIEARTSSGNIRIR